jgi:hypothetical protein
MYLFIGVFNLLYIKSTYNQEYIYHRKSVAGFLMVIFVAYAARFCNDISYLVDSKYHGVYNLMCMVDWSGVRFTLIALAFTYFKNSKEPLS